MMRFDKDFGPAPTYSQWIEPLEILRRGDIRIAHIDAGVMAHPALGFDGDAPPPNLHIDIGKNFYDPDRVDGVPRNAAKRPYATGRVDGDLASHAYQRPDHGVKTLSIILGAETDRLRGVAVGAHVVPYRVANGPIFFGKAEIDFLAAAIEDAITLDPPCRVISVSMGNPGFLGILEPVRTGVGGEIGGSRRLRDAISFAYERGIIVVCAAGQIVRPVVYPAFYPRTIAVGGFSKHGTALWHYPIGGYSSPDRVDIWAQAVGLNRASVKASATDPSKRWIYADQEGIEPDEVSGTSYACPQVAAAAALWFARHEDKLLSFFRHEPWKIVESFRETLRNRGRLRSSHLGTRDGRRADIWTLNIPGLLKTAPKKANLQMRDE